MNAYTGHLENQRDIVTRNRNVSPDLSDFSLQIYFRRPAEHHSLKFLDRLKTFQLIKVLLASFGSQQISCPQDGGSSSYYIFGRGNNEDYTSAAIILFVSPSHSELFVIKIILL